MSRTLTCNTAHWWHQTRSATWKRKVRTKWMSLVESWIRLREHNGNDVRQAMTVCFAVGLLRKHSKVHLKVSFVKFAGWRKVTMSKMHCFLKPVRLVLTLVSLDSIGSCEQFTAVLQGVLVVLLEFIRNFVGSSFLSYCCYDRWHCFPRLVTFMADFVCTYCCVWCLRQVCWRWEASL